jgi:cation:H+ antiporter
MAWIQFVLSAAVMVAAATQLAKYGDVIALRTRLGGMFVGTLLLAGATSLPELLTSINAVGQDAPALTVGNIFGSNMFNMFLLALLDIFYWRAHFLRRLGIAFALNSGLAVAITGLAMFFILAQINIGIGWVGLDSLILIVGYIAVTRLLFAGPATEDNLLAEVEPLTADIPSLRRGLIGFAAATIVLVLITPLMVRSAIQIAEQMGISTGFVGVTLVAVITSLPEVVTCIAAARMGAYEMAAGNLFGSNTFNIFALGLTDFFYTDGRFLAAVSSEMVLAGSIALLLTHVALLGNLFRNVVPREDRWLVVEIDSLLISLGYLLGMILIYDRGLIG